VVETELRHDEKCQGGASKRREKSVLVFGERRGRDGELGANEEKEKPTKKERATNEGERSGASGGEKQKGGSVRLKKGVTHCESALQGRKPNKTTQRKNQKKKKKKKKKN